MTKVLKTIAITSLLTFALGCAHSGKKCSGQCDMKKKEACTKQCDAKKKGSCHKKENKS